MISLKRLLSGIVVGLGLSAQCLAATCITPPAGLVSWWPGDYTTTDRTSTNHGQIVGSVGYAAGIKGAALSFDGSSGYVRVPDSAALRPANLTLSAWVRPTSLNGSSWNTIIARGTSGSFPGLGCCADTFFLAFYQGRPQFGSYHTSGDVVLNATNAVALNQWHHMAATFDGTRTKLFLNGVLVASSNVTAALVYDTNAVPVTIGEDINNFSQANVKFAGQIDEVDLYNRALGDLEVQSLYTAGSAGKCFSPATGTTVPYFTDFENGIGSEWSAGSRWETTQRQFFTRFSGRYNNDAQILTLTNLTPGQAYTLAFDFYPIDSWDGTSGGDTLRVSADGVALVNDTFANYNGNPPQSSQSFRAPDQGRDHFGFHASYVDSIYRSIEVSFVPSNSVAQLSFSGVNLQTPDDESWGFDNVRVRSAADTSAAIVHSTTLPPHNSTTTETFDTFIIAASRPLLAVAASAAANYSLREAGVNGTLGNDDDVLLSVTPAFTSGRAVTFTLGNSPIQPGKYRFQTLAGLLDTNSAAVTPFSHDFTVAPPTVGRIESTANDTIATATTLPVTETPSGSAFLTAFGSGTISSTTDSDFWRFDAETGDRITVRVEAELNGVYPQLQLQNGAGSALVNVGGNIEGIVGFQNYTIPAPGSYYLRVFSNNARSRYQLRFEQARGTFTEGEVNDSQAAANPLALTISPGLYQSKVTGALPGEDSAGDFFRLGTLNVGNTISVNAQFPSGSSLSGATLALSVQLGGNPATLLITNGGVLNYTVPSNGVYYIRAESTVRDIRSQYLLNVAVSDAVAPQITATTFPAEAAVSTQLIDRFTLSFSEDLSPITVSNAANYELRQAGPDNSFNTPDDSLYTVATTGYASGLSSAYTILDGPLQPGRYRFTASGGIRDRADNALTQFTRTFTITNLALFVFENRNNNMIANATPVTSLSGGADGTFSHLLGFGTRNNPQHIVALPLNTDTNIDLITANYGGDSISTFTNNGAAGFALVTNISTGNGAVAIAVAELNGDANPDLAVANYAAHTVSILLNNGGGSFTVFTNYAGFSNPFNLELRDLNNDGRADLVVPNYSQSRVAVMLGAGGGVFQAPSNYVTGSNPGTVGIGDFNGDLIPDIAVANYGSATVTLLAGTGNGTFQTRTNLPVGPNPRTLALADVTGDSVLDLVVEHSGDNTVGVLRGNGNGTFQSRVDFPTGTTDSHHIVVADLNGDGARDLVVPGYGNNTFAVLLNDGTGTFTSYLYDLGGNPIAVAVADYNGDAIPDLAFAGYHGHNVNIFLGNRQRPLLEDPPSSGLKSGFARGVLADSGDVDYYRFYGMAGDRMALGVDVPGNPGNSGLRYRIMEYDGSVLTEFVADNAGWGQSSPITLPYTGTYVIQVTYHWEYYGEYRLRVTTTRPPGGIEAEPNNSVGQANGLAFTLTNTQLRASMSGFLSVADAPGDLFNLGHLDGGTVITLGTTQPSSSGAANVISIIDNAGNTVATSAAGSTNLAYTVPGAASGIYYARLTAGTGGYAGSSAFAGNFDGADDFVDTGAWSPGGRWSVEAWVRPSSVPGGRRTIAGGMGACLDWGITMQDGQFGVVIRQPGGCSLTLTSGVFAVPGTWYHVAGSSDGSIARIYVNGVLRNSGAVEPEYAAYAGGTRIGSEVCCGGNSFPGVIDEVSIWNRALTEPEITASISTPWAGNETGLLGYWRFNQGFGSAVADLTGQHNGTFANGASWIGLGPTGAASPGLAAQYILNVTLADAQGPSIVGVSLPPESSTTSNFINNFTVTVDEDLDASVNRANRNPVHYNGRSYFVTETALTWPAAQALAVSLGGHLVTINDADENEMLRQNFSSLGSLWIGLSDAPTEGAFGWASGESVTFTSWNNGEPNNSNNEDYALLLSTGRWNDAGAGSIARAIIEISSSADADTDGLANGVDPFPSDALNQFDLRASGSDTLFDTSDDIIYDLNLAATYIAGTNLSFTVSNGPLQPGSYRFRVTTSLRDRYGNAMAAPFTRLFTIGNAPGFVGEGRYNDTFNTATPLALASTNADGSLAYSAAYATGNNPYGVVSGRFNSDTNLDLVVANYGSDSISFLAGRGDGTFHRATNYAVQNAPVAIVAGHFDSDTNLDVAVAHYSANTVSILRGNGDGTFQISSNYPVASRPLALVAADFNADGRLDLATPNETGNSVSVLIYSNGVFRARTDYPISGTGNGIAAGDVNGDGSVDIVAASYSGNLMNLLAGNGDGTFQPASMLASGVANPRTVALGYLNTDAHLDLVVFASGNDLLQVFLGTGGGAFTSAATYGSGMDDVYRIDLADLNADGSLDLLLPSYGADRFFTLLNTGSGAFGSQVTYVTGGNPIDADAADFNNDGRLDVALARYTGAGAYVLLGNDSGPLQESPPSSGVRTGVARGSLPDNADIDFFSFTAREGDLLNVAIEMVGAPTSSGLRVDIYGPAGRITEFYGDFRGYGQLLPLALGAAGTYAVSVDWNYDHPGEYRLRTTLVRPPMQIESEGNDSINQADALVYAFSPGRQSASVFGYIHGDDTAGDYFQLGNLTIGTTISLGVRQPTNSTLSGIIHIYSAGGTLVTNSAAGATNLVLAVNTNTAYFARVSAAAGTAGVLATYILDIDLADTEPPVVLSTTLPADGTTTFGMVDRFTASFSEDMAAPSVTNSAHYDLRAAGPDTAFGSGDDEFYTVVNSPAYSIGLSASYLITDGPLQPGNYRLTIRTNLADRAGLNISAPFVQTFTVSNVAGFVFESRANGSAALATSLATNFLNTSDGSLRNIGATAVQQRPEYLTAGRVNGDAHLDLIVPNYGSDTFSVLLGNGNGTFQVFSNYTAGNGALSPVLGYFNSDSNLDLAVTLYNNARVAVFLGNGDGTFQSSSNYVVGSQPHRMASGDFNADGRLDLATANFNSANMSVLLGNGDGTFVVSSNYAAGSGPSGIAVGDVNGDEIADIVTANATSDNLSLFLGTGTGAFASALSLAANNTPRSVALGDLNGDGALDLAVGNGGDNTLAILLGNGDGSFQTRISYPAGTSESYDVAIVDLDGDGVSDVAMTGYHNSVLSIFLNLGNGTLGTPAIYGTGSAAIGIASGDFNGDGRTDIATANYSANNIHVFLNNGTEVLRPDSANGVYRIGLARGNLFNSADQDFYSFSARAGERVLIAAEMMGAPGSSGLQFVLYEPDGSSAGSFTGDFNGRGDATFTLAVSGRYTLRVDPNYNYFGEYRLRVLIIPGTLQVETENNDSTGQANTLAFAEVGGRQRASVAGYISAGESAGDYFRLGNVTEGTVINLDFGRPQSSSLIGVLAIYNSSGLVSNGVAGVTNLSVIAPTSDAYFARVYSASNSAGILAMYQLNLDVVDAAPPAITSVTLPAAGSTNDGIIYGFSLNVNKDLVTTLNALSRSIFKTNGHSYLLSDASGTWLGAQTQARALGGHLATINDAEENEWLRVHFGGNHWIGFTDEAQEGSFSWVSGEPTTYTGWNAGEPNNSGNEDYGVFISTGRWNDEGVGGNHRGIIEVSGTDSDGDGIPDTLDPFPNDFYNLFDLRTAGADAAFDTDDDEVYRLVPANYTSGLTINFTVTDGPLQPGNYRFRVTTSLRDRFGNSAPANADRFFTIGSIAGYVLENRSNDTRAGATPIEMIESPAGLRSGGARGRLSAGSDADYWSFTANAGDRLMLGIEVPGFPGASGLRYRVFDTNGVELQDFYAEYTGEGQTPALVLPTNGTYTVLVNEYWGYRGEYQFRAMVAAPPLQFETEANNTIATASPLTLGTSGDSRFAGVAGYIRSGTDLDYFSLGNVTNGSSIFVSARLPVGSEISPVVSIYNAANQYQPEAGIARTDDAVAEVRVTQSGNYYAVIRGSDATSGPEQQYVLDLQVVPTGSISFPNLQVVAIAPPTGGSIQSGQPVTFTFTVQNVGSLATPGAAWIDRAVMSLNGMLGDADDIPLGFLAHSGALISGASYIVTNTVTLPDGISGNYYIIVQTDSGNAVNEFLLEGDNTTVSGTAFTVNRAPYADLVVENLSINGPDSNRVYTATWTTANRGNAPAAAGFRERFFVRNQTTGSILVNAENVYGSVLPAGGTVPNMRTFVATNSGTYIVQITPDSQDVIYEFDAVSHASAELNTASTNFSIQQFFNVAVQSSPAGAGTLTGVGSYPSGTIVTVGATPNTNTLPYFFVNWTEGGTFQSSSSNYNFILTRDRTLTANFALPNLLVTASNNPPVAGTVAGQGSFPFGTTNVLTANANPGYRFSNWTQNGVVVSTSNTLTTVVLSNRFVVANYAEANTFHVVTTATSPTNVAAVTGAGTYNNGQSTTITAPVSLTNAGNVYTFREFRLNGAFAGTAASFLKTFSTLDPTNMQFVAVYEVTSVKPLVTSISGVVTNPALGGFTAVVPPVGAISNFQLVVRFDRTMNTTVVPSITISNLVGSTHPSVATGGVWFTTAVSNDTYRTPHITFSSGMDGTNRVRVAAARDLNAFVMDGTNVLDLLVDVTPPAHPVISLNASNDTYATFSWNGYSAPADLNGFRVYLSTNNFSSIANLTPVAGLSAGSRGYTYFGLALDRPYYAAVAAVDAAGNSAAAITPVAFVLPRTIPPPVTISVTATDFDSAQVNWGAYNTANLLGFDGFRLYYETSDFSSVAALAPRQTLSPGTRNVVVNGLDRTRTYYFAVVGFNSTNGLNPSVTTRTWTDPYAGTIGANLTLGGGGQSVIDVLQPITVVSNATLTVQPGTTVRFAPGAGITVQQGRLFANGTALDPIVFTSINDPGNSPTAGSWNGIALGSGAGNSLLRHVFVKYGAGLSIDASSPTVDAFTAEFNTPAGLTLLNSATLTTSDALLVNNGVGAQQSGAAQLNLRSSVVKNNGTNALAAGSATLVATQNWWGTPVAAEIDAALQGSVNRSSFLAFEPLLTPAIGMSNNVTQVGTSNVNLRLASRTAESMRLSEDSTFTSVFFQPFANAASFPLSAGGGQKTIYAQYRSITGQTSAPVSVTINYITVGPSIAAFSLNEGQTISRPITVTGSASAPLGMAAMELHLNNVLQVSQPGGTFNYLFDPRPLSNAIYRVKLLALDTADNFATRERNVVIAPTPPPAPVITSPATDIVTSSGTATITGTAEPLIGLRLSRNALVVGTATAAANGSFTFANVALVEGENAFVVSAFDDLGSAESATRKVIRDSGPPAAIVMEPVTYDTSRGLEVSWHFADVGERPATFRLFYHTASFASTNGIASVATSSNTLYQFTGLPGGTYFFGVVGYDLAGNPSPLSALVSFNHDPNPPAFSVSYNKSSPVGIGPLRITLTASEPLAQPPSLTLRPNNSAPVSLTVSNTALNTYEGVLNVTPASISGPVALTVGGRDVAGNTFNGTPGGPALSIDVQPPTGAVTTSPLGPVQTTNNVNVGIGLALSEAPKPGTAPTLTFNPPSGASVGVTLAGSGANWSGSLALTPAMGSGLGSFSLSVTDALDNVGHLITSGEQLEIYNTAFPNPPGQPVGFQATALAGGFVRLNWNAVSNAEIYRVYREPGTNFLPKPVTLVADNVTSNSYVDLPATDGPHRFVVSAVRRGAEGTNSITRVSTSDRLPPPAPTNVVVVLTANGVQVTWVPGIGETPARYNVYRNGTLIRTLTGLAPVTDHPPRGVASYTVGAADALGNEALSAATSIELFVGAVNNLLALVNVGQAPQLSWEGTDGTAIGYNIYRNGIRQNAAPSASLSFVDSLGVPPGGAINYAVRAVNATNAESAPRTIEVRDIALSLQANFSGGSENALVNRWFDKFHVAVSNRTLTSSFPLDRIELRRTISGEATVTRSDVIQSDIGGGNWLERDIVFAGASSLTPQVMRVQAIEETDLGGSRAVYQALYDMTVINPPGVMIEVSANQQPLAGGLATLNLTIFNKGHADMDLLMNRAGGGEPGDLYISVKNTLGQEVSRLDVRATPLGQIFTADGRGFMRVTPGSSISLPVSGILVPEALGTNTATFEAVFPQIYYRLGSAQQVVAGPLSGSMNSSLAVTPYFGTATPNRSVYADEDNVVISGQAVDRQTGLPRANAPLKIGFFTRGYRFYYDVTTDTNGNYTYVYTPPQGLSGTFKIWAAHPDVFDVLNQAEIRIYRAYFSPGSADVRLSKNDRLPFTLRLINPGDDRLDGFTLESQVYQLAGTNRIPTTNVAVRLTAPNDFSIGGRETERVPFEMTATLDAPDNVVVEFTLRSSQGAGAKFEGNVTLLPANPILTVIDPPVGYVDLSVNRGALISKTVTIVNRGLRELKGVTLDVPTNVSWITVNLPIAEDGRIHMPDMPVGLSNSFTVVFSPPTNAALQYYEDRIVVRGTNLPAGFNVNVYALVTSSQKGAVQFFVDNILAQPVPNATVRIKNTLLQQEYTVRTDANGYVTVPDLQEGAWAWQVTASGHSSSSGVIDVIANNTVLVDTRLSKSLVTVNFSVVPVPFTDRYEIIIEQTFETHVPAPVLVVTPPLIEFNDLEGRFEATYIATVKNAGLIQMTDVQIRGGYSVNARLIPLINYFPVLRAQEQVEVPMHFVFDEGTGTNAPAPPPALAKGRRTKSLGPQIDENGNITQPNIEWPENWNNPNAPGNGCTGGIFDLDNFFGALNAIIAACAKCVDAKTLMAVTGGLKAAYKKVLKKKGNYWAAIEAVVKIYELLGCPTFGGSIGNGGNGGGDSGGGGGGPGTFTGYGGGGAACFIAGTQVLMADGSLKAIEEIQLGDRVRTGLHQKQTATVAEVLNREVNEVFDIEFSEAAVLPVSTKSANRSRVTASGEHMFWVDGQGWVAARRLKAGDWLFTSSDARVQITSVTRVEKKTRVFTFTNREDNAFYANGILVRDSCGDKTPYFKKAAEEAAGDNPVSASLVPLGEMEVAQ